MCDKTVMTEDIILVDKLPDQINTQLTVVDVNATPEMIERFGLECYKETIAYSRVNSALVSLEDASEDDGFFVRFFKYIGKLFNAIWSKIIGAFKAIFKWLGLIEDETEEFVEETASSENIENKNIDSIKQELQEQVDKSPEEKVTPETAEVINSYVETAGEQPLNKDSTVGEALTVFAETTSSHYGVDMDINIPEELVKKYLRNENNFERVNENNKKREKDDKVKNNKATQKPSDTKVKMNKQKMAANTLREVRHKHDEIFFTFNKDHPPFNVGYLSRISEITNKLLSTIHACQREFNFGKLTEILEKAVNESRLVANANGRVNDNAIPDFIESIQRQLLAKGNVFKGFDVPTMNIGPNTAFTLKASVYKPKMTSASQFTTEFPKQINKLFNVEVKTFNGDNGLLGNYSDIYIRSNQLNSYAKSLNDLVGRLTKVTEELTKYQLNYKDYELASNVFDKLFGKGNKGNKSDFLHHAGIRNIIKTLVSTIGGLGPRIAANAAKFVKAVSATVNKQISIINDPKRFKVSVA